MKTRPFLAVALATLALAADAAVDVEMSPAAKARDYRKVLIAPARVELDQDFLSPYRRADGHLPRITREDARKIAREMGESFEAALAEAFRAHGFEIARAPGADVLSLTPALKGLRVNAPEGSGASAVQVYVREAGAATMEVEAFDSAGRRLVHASEARTTGRIVDLARATDVSNRFWFDALFRRWANEVAAGIAHPK